MSDNPMRILKWVTPDSLREGHSNAHLVRLLHESIVKNPLSDDIEALLNNIYAKSAVLWTWKNEHGEGILITYLKSFPQHPKVLVMTNLCGEGYLRNLAEIEHDITELARSFECTHIIGEVMHQGLVKVYEKLGARAIYQMYREVPK
jgi:hypothetical protein